MEKLLKRSVIAVTLLFATFTSNAYAQQVATSQVVSKDTSRGIRLYEQGDTTGAIEAFRTVLKNHKNDAVAWHYLGLAQTKKGDVKNARMSFEAAIKLRPKVVESHVGLSYALLLTNKLKDAKREAEFALGLNPEVAVAHYILGVVSLRSKDPAGSLREADTALSLDANLAQAHLLRSQALMGLFVSRSESDIKMLLRDRWIKFRDAAQSLEKYVTLSSGAPDIEVWRKQLESLQSMAGTGDQPDISRTVFLPSELTNRARVLVNAAPVYTLEARKNGIEGTVILLAVLTSDGKVTTILVLQGLPEGLTQMAIIAASKIKFEPATIDGKPVSMAMQLEYNFRLY